MSDTNLQDTDLMQEYVEYYFNNIFFNSILNLSTEDRGNVFTMLTTHVDVLHKLLDAGNHPILDHIKGTPWATANTVVENHPHVEVNYEQAQPLIASYDEWKSSRTS
jgi:hypothetical protein